LRSLLLRDPGANAVLALRQPDTGDDPLGLIERPTWCGEN